MKKILGIGREPGRSIADRSIFSARRGRFSPSSFFDRSVLLTGRSAFRGRPLVLRHLHGLRTVIAVCLAVIVLIGLPVSTSGEPAKAGRKAKATKSSKSSKASRSSSSAKTVNKSTKRSTPATTTSRKPDYKSKFRPIKPPPADGGRPSKYKKPDRPTTRPAKDKKPRPDPPPSNWRRPIEPPPSDWWIGPIEPPYPGPPMPIPDPPRDDRDYDQSTEAPKNIDFTSMLLTSVSIVWNTVYIKSGQPNEFVATAGFFTGISSLALAFSGKSDHSEMCVLFGTAAIVFSVLNLAGGVDSQDQAEYRYYDDDPYYNSQPTFANQVEYSYSF